MSAINDILRKAVKTKGALTGASAAAPLAGSAYVATVGSTVPLLFPAAPLLVLGGVVAGGAWLGWHVGSAIVGEVADWLDGK